jgi:hypothetical protein
LVTLRKVTGNDSMAFVVEIMRRISAGKAKNGITRSQWRCHRGAMAGYFATH